MNILLVPLGSHGDVHPFVGVGLALRERGHRARVLVNPFFQPLVERAGLEAIPIGTTEDYISVAGRRELWNSSKGPRIVFSMIGSFLRPIYEAIVANHIPGQTAVVASTLSLGARVAEERYSIPTATLHLQPAVMRSLTDPPTLQGMLLGARVPRWAIAAQWFIADRLVIDPLIRPALNAFRKEVGLLPVSGILRDYIHSPARVIGMWPQWFAPSQPDWPPQARLTGFPLYDERGVSGLSSELQEFLANGSPPVAFTFGSAMWHAHELLEQSARCCQKLGQRGILLTRHREHLPAKLPADVKHVDFAPFSELLPHCRALVHHGGIGTSSQALAAGVPQVVLPHAHDQLDNATRMQRLGVARIIDPKRYNADRLAGVLSGLIADENVMANCQRVRGLFAGSNPLSTTCDLIEQLIPY